MVENRKGVAESMLGWHAVSPLSFINLGSKGWRSKYGSGSNLGVNAICGLSLLLVLSLAPRGFSPGNLVFLSPKTNISKFQFDQGSGRRRTTLWMCFLQIIIIIIIETNELNRYF